MWSVTPRAFGFATVAAGTLFALAGCGDEAESPAAPASTPAAMLEVAAAATVSFTQVSAGGSHTCALATDSRVYCWGLNEHGELGDGTRANHSSPQVVAGTLRFVQVSAGASHTCSVTADNRAYCWGLNENGQVGGGTTAQDALTPTAVAGGRRFVHIRAGTYHTCAVNPYDVAFCWGKSAFGELGAGTNYSDGTPIRVSGGLSFRRVVAGGGFTCGTTTSSKAYCWGYNLDGAVGDGTRINRSKPTAVTGGLGFKSVVAGGGLIDDAQGEQVDETHACGLTTTNLAYCWGQNSNGQLGIGAFTGSVPKPSAVHGGLHFGQVIAGYYHSCGVTTTKVAYCWGLDDNGQLGDGGRSQRAVPTKVAGGLFFAGVSAGPAGKHTCGITTGKKIYCWGNNAFGQLGDRTTTTRLSPVKVAGQS